MTTSFLPLTGEALAQVMEGGTDNVSVERALEGLSAEDAVRVPDGLPHSVAHLLAHMDFWQAYVLARARGEQPTYPAHAVDSWPDVSPESYQELKARFFDTLEALRALTADSAFLASPYRDGRPWALNLLGIATHNVYHVGQIVLTRRALGAWPPPSGGDTW